MTSTTSLVAGHVLLAIVPWAVGLALALLLAQLVRLTGVGSRTDRVLMQVVTVLAGLPVVAVWVLLPLLTGLPLLRALHLEVALSLLAIGVLFPVARRHVGLRPDQWAARALTMSLPRRVLRTVRVWLPGLAPALARTWGYLVAAVTLAAVLSDQAAQGLGQLMVRGWRDELVGTVLWATGLTLAVAVVGDLLIRVMGRVAGIREVR